MRRLDITLYPVEHLLMPVNLDLDFGKKYCTFVVQKWGIGLNAVYSPLFCPQIRVKKVKALWKFRDGSWKKVKGLLKLSLGLCEKCLFSFEKVAEQMKTNPKLS